MGATVEAKALLQSIDSKKNPQVLFFQALILFTEWDYTNSIPLLDQYLGQASLSAYDRTLAETNLVAALVHERNARATSALQELLSVTKKENYYLLYGNGLILSIEHSIFEKAHQTEMFETFFLRKWKALALLYRKGKGGIAAVEAIKEEAIKRNHSETVRDCDYHLATVLKDKERLIHLYFGTPFPQYRKHLLSQFDPRPEIPDFYLWSFNGNKKSLILDLFDRSRQGKKELKSGQVLHRTLSVLVSDFYRPVRIAALHAALFPGDYFNPLTSSH